VSGLGLLRDDEFGFKTKHSTAILLARLLERVSRNFNEKILTGAVFLDVAKAFDTVWVDVLLYKITILNFPSYFVKTISSYLKGRTFETSFQTATSVSRRMGAGVAQGGIISPFLCNLYVNDMPSPSVHVELALPADDTAVIATSHQPMLLVKYLDAYLSEQKRVLSERMIAINVLKSSAMHFAKTSWRFPKPRAVQLFMQPKE
jgi:retron-type reverse transcriptase